MKKNDLQQYIDEKRDTLFHVSADIYPRTHLVRTLVRTVSPEYVTVLTGMRRAGKSFLLRLFARHLSLEQHVPRDHFFFLNFEDPDLIDFSVDDFRTLRTMLHTKSEAQTAPLYLFCDEVQAVIHIDRMLQSIQELSRVHVVVTGSNAKLLSREISTLLTGRHRDIFVPTLQYREYVERSGCTVDVDSFRTYMTHAGFPLPALTHDDDMVKQYFNDIVIKDILVRHRLYTNKAAIIRLYTYILSNIKNQFSMSDIHAALPEIGSKTSIAKFLSYLADSYVIVPLQNYHYSLKKRYRDKTKFYTLDNGFITQVGDYVLDRSDTLMENAVFKELYALAPGDVYFLRKREHKYDVDFYVPSGATPLLVNATLGFQNKQTKEREISSLFAAMEDVRTDVRAYVVALDEPEEELVRDGKTVTVIPAHTCASYFTAALV